MEEKGMKKKKKLLRLFIETFYLSAFRRMIASEQKIPPYMVFSDKTLVHMSTMKPSNDEEMLEVNGVGEHKLQKYGERFLNEIQKYK